MTDNIHLTHTGLGQRGSMFAFGPRLLHRQGRGAMEAVDSAVMFSSIPPASKEQCMIWICFFSLFTF